MTLSKRSIAMKKRWSRVSKKKRSGIMSKVVSVRHSRETVAQRKAWSIEMNAKKLKKSKMNANGKKD